MQNILNFYFKNNYFIIFTTVFISFAIFLIINSVNNTIDLKLKLANDNSYNDLTFKFYANRNLNNTIKINKIEKEINSLVKNKFKLHDDYIFQTIPNESLNLPKPLHQKFVSVVSNPNINFQTLPKEVFSNNLKKSKFIISILPIVAYENEKILAKRSKLFEIQNYLDEYKTLDKKNQLFLENLASEYKIAINNKHKIDIVNKLIEYVDVIPNSIVIAQAANESGWGYSRFAREFNALFGEYTFDANNGIVPYYREEGKKHFIKFFPSINESIQSYFMNINTHSAYINFRKKRKFLRDNNLNLNPLILSNMLDTYAEDKNYVKTIQSIIKVNNLNLLDNVRTLSTSS